MAQRDEWESTQGMMLLARQCPRLYLVQSAPNPGAWYRPIDGRTNHQDSQGHQSAEYCGTIVKKVSIVGERWSGQTIRQTCASGAYFEDVPSVTGMQDNGGGSPFPR